MDDIDTKRETNQNLFRNYYSNQNKKLERASNLYQLVDFNIDLICEVIIRDFNGFKYRKDIYEIGLCGLITAIQLYDLEKMCSFEVYCMSVIHDKINQYMKAQKPLFVIDNHTNMGGFNVGDIWYNMEHDFDDLIKTKKVRDQLLTKTLSKGRLVQVPISSAKQKSSDK